MVTPIFDQLTQISLNQLLAFLDLHQHEKSVDSIYPFLRYSQFQSPVSKLVTLIFDHVNPKIFCSSYNLCEFVSKCKIWNYSINWTSGGSRKDPMKQGLSVLPSFRPSGHFLRIVSLVFSKYWHGARNPYEFVRDRARFSRKIFLPPKLGNWTKNGPKTGFFKFIEKFCH